MIPLLRLAAVFAAVFVPVRATAAKPPPFRFHLFSESHGLDPQLTSSASGNYLFHCLYRGLFSYHSRKGLVPVGASSCTRGEKSLTCRLRPERRWSNGEPIVAAQYVAAFRRLIDPANASPQADILFSLKNARAIWAGKKKPEELGVLAPDGHSLRFEFERDDPEFEYKLIHPALSPLPPGGYPSPAESSHLVTSGPYKITRWKAGSYIHFEPNPYSPSADQRPPAEAWFVDDDSAALHLYEAGRLDFLRRLTANEIPRFKKSPEFHQIPMARFDYIGFGPELAGKKHLRRALVEAIEFPTFLKMIDTLSPPGCPSLPSRYMDKVTCRHFDPAQAKAELAREPGAGGAKTLEFHFSRMGGEDVARAAEWLQGQWKKNLGLSVRLQPEEQGVYLKHLRARPPAIFRKGVGLDRPTCLAALEIFTDSNPENYIRLQDAEFKRLVGRVKDAGTETARRRACRKAVDYLIASDRLIPLGEMFFTVLAKPRFTGWDLNELNQLDLSDLRYHK